MSGNHKIIEHDGGSVGVSAEVINKDKACLIRFGSSFTLRVNEANLDKLRDLLNDSKLIFNQIKSQTERALDASHEQHVVEDGREGTDEDGDHDFVANGCW